MLGKRLSVKSIEKLIVSPGASPKLIPLPAIVASPLTVTLAFICAFALIFVVPAESIVNPFCNVDIVLFDNLKLGTSIPVALIKVVEPGVPTVKVEPVKSNPVTSILVVPFPKSTTKLSPTLKSPSWS